MSVSYPVSELSLRPSDNGTQLFLENVALNDLTKRFGTPLYVYSKKALSDMWQAWQYPTEERTIHVCYAVKACSNLHVLRLFAERGAFFDTVSEGSNNPPLEKGDTLVYVVDILFGADATA